jgi:hypothetical protein
MRDGAAPPPSLFTSTASSALDGTAAAFAATAALLRHAPDAANSAVVGAALTRDYQAVESGQVPLDDFFAALRSWRDAELAAPRPAAAAAAGATAAAASVADVQYDDGEDEGSEPTKESPSEQLLPFTLMQTRRLMRANEHPLTLLSEERPRCDFCKEGRCAVVCYDCEHTATRRCADCDAAVHKLRRCKRRHVLVRREHSSRPVPRQLHVDEVVESGLPVISGIGVREFDIKKQGEFYQPSRQQHVTAAPASLCFRFCRARPPVADLPLPFINTTPCSECGSCHAELHELDTTSGHVIVYDTRLRRE